MKNIILIIVSLVCKLEVFSCELPAPSSEELEKQFYAVHVTNTLPKDDVMIAGKRNGNRVSMDFEEIRPDPRATLHWTLGTTFPDDDEGTLKLKDAKFAILVPLASLTNIVSISVPEIITLGNFTLTQDCLIVAPTDYECSSIAGIVPYDVSENKIKDAVTKHLRDTSWSASLSCCKYDAIAKIDGISININNPDYFRNFLSDRKIPFGINIYTNEGSANKLGFIDCGVRWLTNILFVEEENLNTSLLEILASMVEWYIPKAIEYVASQSFSHDAKDIFFRKMEDSSKLLHIICLEIMLRKETAPKTLKGAGVDQLKQLWESPKEGAYTLASSFHLPDYIDNTADASHAWFEVFILGFQSLKADDRSSLVDAIRAPSELTLSALKVYNALTHLIHLARPLSSEPATDKVVLFRILEENFPEVADNDLNLPLIMSALCEVTAKTFRSPPSIDLIEEILIKPSIKESLIRLFPDHLTDYDGYLRGTLENLEKWKQEEQLI